MKHGIKLITLVAMAWTSVSSANQAEVRSLDESKLSRTQEASAEWQVMADACWNKTPEHIRSDVWERKKNINPFNQDGSELFVMITKATYFDKNSDNNCSVSLKIPVKTVNESCRGIKTLGFLADGRESLASGKITNLEGRTLGSLFSNYKGRALGAAFIGGVGRWESTSKHNIKIGDSIPAIPIPIAGGNFAFGYTSCETNFDLEPASNEVQLEYSYKDGKELKSFSTTLPLEQILGLYL